MSKAPSPPSPRLNRLRAAAGLIPIIESGLADAKLSLERAALMTKFCVWAVDIEPLDSEEVHLLEIVSSGLCRLQSRLDGS